MRALRVLGMAEDGENLLCEDTVTGEVFSLRSDERLRAAARGELKGTGRRSVETDPQLRPGRSRPGFAPARPSPKSPRKR